MSAHLMFPNLTACLLLCVPLFAWADEQSAGPVAGIAGGYAGDVGIEEDSRVIFAEDFEGPDIETIGQRWETVRDADAMSLSNDVPPASSGRQSLLITQLAENGTGADLYRRLDEGYDKLYARMYVKFAEDCEPVHHFGTCVGGNNPSTAWPSVRAGQPTQGDKSFWVGIEPFGADWRWDYYTYWCEMRGSPPRGQTWGNSFIRDDSLQVRRGQWTCVEVMVKMNDVGDTDGELALWIDGRQVSHLGKGFPRGKWVFDKFFPEQEGEGVRWNHATADREHFTTAAGGDPFEGFRFRTVESLNVNFLWLYLYITKGTPGHANRVWFDDVVVATDFIGPICDKDEASTPADAPPRQQIGAVLGRPVYRDEIGTGEGLTLSGELHQVFSSPVLRQYREEHQAELTPTEAEISAAIAYFHKRHLERLKDTQADLKRQLATVEQKLAEDNLEPDAKRKLEIERETLQVQLTPPGRSFAMFVLDNWKLQRHLYDHFGGGRILWQQAGLEAFDAMHQWLNDQEKSGKFRIADPALRSAFYEYWTTTDHGPFLTADRERIRREFLEPPWLAEERAEE